MKTQQRTSANVTELRTKDSHARNAGTKLLPEWFEDIAVNRSATERRAATLTTRRADPKEWDIFITHSNFPGDPTTINTITDTYPGWYVSDQKAKAVAAYMEATTDEAKKAAWDGIQTVIYDDAPLYKVGNFNAVSGVAAGITDYTPTYWPKFWNVTPKE